MAHKAPGKSHRAGVTPVDLIQWFPTEDATREWFEGIIWSDGLYCGHCGSVRMSVVNSGRPMPYRCKDCRKYFSVKMGTAVACSNVPVQKWAIAVYLCLTNLRSVSSMKLHRDLGVTRRTAARFEGPAEVDESHFGGLRKNMSTTKRKDLKGR